MGKWLEKYARSFRFWILASVAVYFGYAVYYAVYGLSFSVALLSDNYVHNLVSKNPWWWMFLYYGSEGVLGSVASVLRAVGGVFAFYAAFIFWRKKDNAIPQIRNKVRAALILEAAFFLCFILTITAAFAYNSTSQYLYYFDHTPGLLLLFGTAFPCLAMVIVVAPLLLKLSSTIQHMFPKEEVIKWSCLTGVAYIFVVFWFNFLMLWEGTMVPFPASTEIQYGVNFLLEPANFSSFVLTFFGLLAIALIALLSTLPAIKKQPTKLNLAWIGIVLPALGTYFLFSLLYYYATGGYAAHPSVWYEVIGPLHNSNLWPAAFIFLGPSIIAYSRIKMRAIPN